MLNFLRDKRTTIAWIILMLVTNTVAWQLSFRVTAYQFLDTFTNYCYNYGGMIQGTGDRIFACAAVKMPEEEKQLYRQQQQRA